MDIEAIKKTAITLAIISFVVSVIALPAYYQGYSDASEKYEEVALQNGYAEYDGSGSFVWK